MAGSPLTVAGARASFRQERALAALRVSSTSSSAAAFAQVVQAAALPADTGPTYAAQLTQKAAQVKAILEKYTELGPVAPLAVEDAIATIDAWRKANGSLWARIEQKLVPMDSTVSQQEALAMPAQLLRAYVEALYQEAVVMIPWYTSGVWQDLVDQGTFSALYVRDDAVARLAMLDTVLTLEEAGSLAPAYDRSGVASKGTAGFGSPIVVGEGGLLIVLGIVACVAVLAFVGKDFYVAVANNDLKRAECDKWLTEKDPRHKDACKPEEESDSVKIGKQVALVGGLCLLAYAVIQSSPQLLGALWDEKQKRSRARA